MTSRDSGNFAPAGRFVRLMLVVLFGICLRGVAAAEPNPDAASVLVVFNTNDVLSGLMARYYADKRGIPADQVVGLDCSINEEITREEYERTIESPLRNLFTTRGWWTFAAPGSGAAGSASNKIRFVALLRGIPLKIDAGLLVPKGGPAPPPLSIAAPTPTPTPGPTPKPMERREASVDTELACLGIFGKRIDGVVANPYFRSFQRIGEATGLAPMMLVCRIDGPTAASVKQIIDDSLEAEAAGLGGFAFIDARSMTDAGYKEGDEWLFAAAKDLRDHGLPVILDKAKSVFPDGYPMQDAAIYLGWYSEQPSGPFLRPDFRFRKGAVAVHIHSFSADSIRNPTRYWVGPLLDKGAAATLGNVYEPYLGLTPNLDVFANRLLNGFTLAEAAYMSIRGLSWMTTIVGDPLYRPFAAWTRLDGPRSQAAGIEQWNRYRTIILTNLNAPDARDAALRKEAESSKNGMFLEGLAQIQLAENKPDAALKSLEQARSLHTNADSKIRTAVAQARLIQETSGIAAATAFIRGQLENYPADAPATAALRALDLELNPPPPPPTPAPGPTPGATPATASPAPPPATPRPARTSAPARRATPTATPTPPPVAKPSRGGAIRRR